MIVDEAINNAIRERFKQIYEVFPESEYLITPVHRHAGAEGFDSWSVWVSSAVRRDLIVQFEFVIKLAEKLWTTSDRMTLKLVDSAGYFPNNDECLRFEIICSFWDPDLGDPPPNDASKFYWIQRYDFGSSEESIRNELEKYIANSPEEDLIIQIAQRMSEVAEARA